MWDILRQSLVLGPGTNDLIGISDLDLLQVGDGLFVVATTRASPGITVLQVNSISGQLSKTDRMELPSDGLFPPIGSEVLWFSTGPALLTTARNTTAFPAFGLTATGELGEAGSQLTELFSTSPLATERFLQGDDEFLVVSRVGASAIMSYRGDRQGGFEWLDTYGLDADIWDLAVAGVGDRTFILATYESGNAIQTFEIAENGALRLVSEGGTETQVGISGISVIESVTVGVTTYALVAAFDSSSLTVLEVDQDGDLIPKDHVFDSLTTRFSRASELKIIQDSSHVFVMAAGNDDGFTILQLLPNGKLVLRATLADDTDTTLDNVSGVEFFLDDGTLNIYASGETEEGITHFQADIGSSGETHYGTSGQDTLAGGDLNDVLLGAAGDDILVGGAGDDILADGAGQDDLTGGLGHDLFVLQQDGATDRILDFEPGIDQLDMSQFQNLFSVQGLDVLTTEFGAVVTFRDDITEIYRSGGGGLELADLGGDAVLPLSHGVLPTRSDQVPENLIVQANFKTVSASGRSNFGGGRDGDGALRREEKVFFQSKSGDDTLIGSDLDDTLNGGAGNDTIDGGLGDDVLIGSEGADVFVFGTGSDQVADFEILFDMIQLQTALWNNEVLTAQQVIDTYGSFTNSGLVLTFDEGNSLELTGDMAPELIAGQIIF